VVPTSYLEFIEAMIKNDDDRIQEQYYCDKESLRMFQAIQVLIYRLYVFFKDLINFLLLWLFKNLIIIFFSQSLWSRRSNYRYNNDPSIESTWNHQAIDPIVEFLFHDINVLTYQW